MATQKESIISVPDEYRMTYKRLLNRLPKKKRRDKKLQETLLMCMKLGGEELTRQRIKLEKTKFAEKPELFKRRIPIVPKDPVTPAVTTDEKTVAAESTPATDEKKTPTESTPAADEKTAETKSTPVTDETKTTTESTQAADEKTAATESTPTVDKTEATTK